MASKPKFHVEEMTKDDIPRLVQIIFEILNHREFVTAQFPHLDTPEGRRYAIERHEKWMESPLFRWTKAIDETGNMVGFARWTVWEGKMPPRSEFPWNDIFETEENWKYAQHIIKECSLLPVEQLQKRHGHLTALNMTAIDAAYQRQGAGRTLVEYGLRGVDERGHETIVQASDEGRLLYEQYGFEFKGEIVTSVPVEFQDGKRTGETLHWLIRPARKI